MVDIVDVPTRSRMMAGIRGKDTAPELALRKALHACGCRYRLHAKNLPGRPDIVLPRHRAVILVHGCFWHRHAGCRFTTTPATRAAFWTAKFEANIARDMKVRQALRQAGWRVAVVWECALRNADSVTSTATMLIEWLHGDRPEIEIGDPGHEGRGQPGHDDRGDCRVHQPVSALAPEPEKHRRTDNS